MAHCTLEDLTADWFDQSMEAECLMPRAKSVRNILSYSAGMRVQHTERFGDWIHHAN